MYSYVKNKLIFVPGKWRRVHTGNKSGDLSIAQWLILSCTQPNINCVGKICPHMGPLEALICVIITLNLFNYYSYQMTYASIITAYHSASG